MGCPGKTIAKKCDQTVWIAIMMVAIACAVSPTWALVTQETGSVLGDSATVVTVPSIPLIINTPAASDRPIETPAQVYTPAETSISVVSDSVSSFFPLGFMWVKVEHLGQVAEGGFDIGHRFAGVWDAGEAQDYLDEARAVGLQVVMDLPKCRAYQTSSPVCQGISIWSEQEWGEYISDLSTYDNLIAWYLPDETSNYEAAANLYTWVKKYDARQRPVYGNPGSFDLDVIRRFPAFSDFVWGAWYPEYYNAPRAIVTFGTKLDASACLGKNVRWGAILQFFDNSHYGKSPDHPTAHELRSDSYQAIIGGAKGLWYFTYEMGKDLPGLWEGVVTIADEIIGAGGLDEVILSPDVPQTITKNIRSGPTQSPPAQGAIYDSIQMLQKGHGETYLFAVNIATGTVTVEFGNLPAHAIAVEVLFEGRTIPFSDGTFRDSFAEADVHVYRMISNRAYLPLIVKLGSRHALDTPISMGGPFRPLNCQVFRSQPGRFQVHSCPQARRNTCQPKRSGGNQCDK